MCELMGMSFARAVSASVTVRAFSMRGEENADGWGLAWYPDRAVAIVKEPGKWRTSPFARFLEGYPSLRSEIYIAHVRYKTTGDTPCYADTHPFVREHRGREYCFAHNGTLEGALQTIPNSRFKAIGATDSERAFCRLLAELDQRGGHLDGPSDWQWLHERLVSLNQLGKLNLLLSDGYRLFAYHDLNAWKGLSLCKISLSTENQTQAVGDSQVEVHLNKGSGNNGYVIATYPLNEGSWRPFRTGEMIVLERGSIRFSSHPDAEIPNFQDVRRAPSPAPCPT